MDAASGTIAKWKPYPKYKDSGVEWLGEVPEHWEVKKIKRLCLVKRGASPRPIDDPIYFDDDGEYSWVRISDVTSSSKYLEKTEQKLSKLGKSKSVVVEPGELFLSIAATVGKPIITNIKCCIHDGFVYFVGLRQDREYLFYLFSSGELYKGLGKLGTQLNLNTDTIGEIRIPVPNTSEQRAIAAFLDRETTKIDALIAKKERLIELLQEKRAALISHAVTKGLDPSAPMKDPGEEWLGEMPAHWDVKRLKFCFEFLNSKRVPISSEERGKMMVKEYPYYGASGIIDYVENYIFEETLILVAEDGANLFSRSTPLAFMASGKYWVNNHAHILRPIEGPIEYWSHLLAIIVYDPWITGSAQPKLTKENLSSIYLPVPPKDERECLDGYLNNETKRVGTLINKLLASIEKLREYRAALISAAVTGKIDVRDRVCLGGTV